MNETNNSTEHSKLNREMLYNNIYCDEAAAFYCVLNT